MRFKSLKRKEPLMEIDAQITFVRKTREGLAQNKIPLCMLTNKEIEDILLTIEQSLTAAKLFMRYHN
jgi:hypothetical protein